jgi:hypothetical protein
MEPRRKGKDSRRQCLGRNRRTARISDNGKGAKSSHYLSRPTALASTVLAAWSPLTEEHHLTRAARGNPWVGSDAGDVTEQVRERTGGSHTCTPAAGRKEEKEVGHWLRSRVG